MDMLAGTLVDRVVEYRTREDARNGIDLDAQAHQFKETAQAHLDSHKKRISAGLLASAGIHALGPNVLVSALVRKRNAEELFTERQNKRQALLTRLGETSHRGNQQAPAEEIKTAVVLAASPIPPILPLGLQLTIVLTHKGELTFQPHCFACFGQGRI